MKPCQVSYFNIEYYTCDYVYQFYQDDVNRFGEANYSIPPSCLVSVYGSPGAVPSLHYSVPLVGVVRPVAIYIHRSLRIPPLPPPSTSNRLIILIFSLFNINQILVPPPLLLQYLKQLQHHQLEELVSDIVQ